MPQFFLLKRCRPPTPMRALARPRLPAPAHRAPARRPVRVPASASDVADVSWDGAYSANCPAHGLVGQTPSTLGPTCRHAAPACVPVSACVGGGKRRGARAGNRPQGLGLVFCFRCARPFRKKTRRLTPSPRPPQPAPPLKYDHLLVTLVDASPAALSDGSRTALAATGHLARAHAAARVTVLLVDAELPPADGQAARERAVGAALQAAGVDPGRVSFVERALDDENAAAAVGDAADGVGADLLVLSSDAVHAKAVDANLLAEFVDCPVLLLP